MKIRIDIPADPRLLEVLGTIARELERIAKALDRIAGRGIAVRLGMRASKPRKEKEPAR